MKILVISDVHGNDKALDKALCSDRYDAVIFCGDGISSVRRAEGEHPRVRFYCVKGNCDFNSSELDEITPIIGGVRFFVTHGHKYHAKLSDRMMIMQAIAKDASVLLYGHTHISDAYTDSGISIMNPGSLGYDGTYGVIETSDLSMCINKI